MEPALIQQGAGGRLSAWVFTAEESKPMKRATLTSLMLTFALASPTPTLTALRYAAA